MKLKLENFRCFKNIELNFPNYGTILLWGNSGIGKTTIFKAINFVLYGKEQKIVKNGEKKCKVELIKDNFHIIRTKGPSHLTLLTESGKFEDDVAQSKIDDLFGKDFLLTGYMAQKGLESFFYLSNVEKSAFLQKLSLKDVDVENIRRKTRDIIRDRKDKLISVSTEKKNLSQQYFDLFNNFDINKDEWNNISLIVEQNNIIDFNILLEKEPSLKLDTKGLSLDEFKSNEDTSREKCKSSLKKINSDIIELENKKNKQSEKIKKKEILEAIITEKNILLEEYQKQLSEIPISNKSTHLELNEYKIALTYFNTVNQLKSCKDEYDKILNEHSNEIESLLDNTILERDKIKNSILSTQQIEELKSLKIHLTTLNNIFLKYFDEEDIYSSSQKFDITVEELLDTLNDTYSEEQLNCDKNTKELNNNQDLLSKLIININEKNKILTDLNSLIIDSESKEKKHKFNCPDCGIELYMDGAKLNKLSNLDKKEIKNKVDLISNEIKELKSTETQLKNKIEILNKNLDKNKIALDKYKNNIKEITNIFKLKKEELKNIYFDKEYFLKLEKDVDENIKNKNTLESLDKKIIDLELKAKMTPDVLPSFLKDRRNKILELKNILENIKNKIDEFELIDIEQLTHEFTENKINELTIQLNYEKENNKKRIQLEDSIIEINKDIELNTSEMMSLLDIKLINIEEEIKNLQQKYKDKQTLLDKYERRKEKIDKYILDNKKYNLIKDIILKLNSIFEQEKLLLRGLSKAETFFKKINQAESLSLENTIESINIEVEEYIQCFFGDNVTVRLVPYKENSKTAQLKSMIDIIIMKDGETISIDSLSGGEFDRVALAFFLAFNKVSKSDIIILDECLSSLQSDLVEEIVSMLRTKLSHKLVLFTLHQGTKGMFDNIIELSELSCNCTIKE